MFVMMGFLTTDHQEQGLTGSRMSRMGEDEEEVLLGSAPDGACSGMKTTKRYDDSLLPIGFLVSSTLALVPSGDDACLGPEAALMVSGTCLQIAPRLRTRFLLHQRDIRLEGQGGAM
jgi:hypothetical protein